MYPFLYKVECVRVDGTSSQVQAGIIYAETYVEAMDKLARYYGENELIEVLGLFPMEDSPVIITGEAYDAIKKGDWDVDTYI